MSQTLRNILKNEPVETSAPCRIDMGGTLDISTFYYPLRYYQPCTVNIALNLRTHVKLLPYTRGRIKISSRGFKSAEYPLEKVPMTHPLGLMFAVVAYFGEDGIEVIVNSTSPPKSGLGGSSAAAVALIGAYLKGLPKEKIKRKNIALLAHALEGSVAGVPCGIQDQLAAAYGGIHAWHWLGDGDGVSFRKRSLIKKREYKKFENRLLLAYCGIPHESKQVNQKWVSQFMAGRFRDKWIEIIDCTRAFSDALTRGEIEAAADWMNRETAIRKRMTPEVLDPVGRRLVTSAVKIGCGARFAGAGGGGCIWALGEGRKIHRLKDSWMSILSKHPTAKLLNVDIASEGLLVN